MARGGEGLGVRDGGREGERKQTLASKKRKLARSAPCAGFDECETIR